MDKISIIIPCYNMGKKVEKCISSIKNQTYENYEAIFVDDGSTDNTATVIQENISDDDRMIYLYKENGGLSSARNHGLKRAVGKYVCFIDSDDYVEKDYVKALYENLMENDSDISICYFNRVYENKTVVNMVKEGTDELLKNPAAWNKLYKTSLFTENDIEFPEGKWYEDLGTFPKLLMLSSKISIVKDPLYNYIQNPTSIMHTYDDRIYQIYDILEDNENFAKKHSVYEEFKENLEFMHVHHVLVGTVFRSSFRDDFSKSTIKSIVKYVEDKYPNWNKNKSINDFPFYFRVYLKMLHKKQYSIIYFLLKTFNKSITFDG